MHPRIHELLTYCDDQRRELRAAFEAVRPALREQAPAPGRWSVANVIEHLAVMETRLAVRFSACVADARTQGVGVETSAEPILSTLDLSAYKDRSNRRAAPDALLPTGINANAAWRALEDATVTLRDAIAEADGLALGTLSMPHRMFGPLSLYYWIAIVGAHEGRHAAQIREIDDALATAGL